MKVSVLIFKLQELEKELGDVEVTITDGYNCACYSGEYSVEEFKGSIDIGIGWCLEND